MRATIALGNIICETESRFMETICPGHRQLNRDIVFFKNIMQGIMQRPA